ncbi:helix-hairpin-helix domain-containing protein [Aquipuribacter nitratireducens]|uniref:Helix-hairpin-helix domain-containing protein n=1 Tax=Aquipuribacter nitratireducens TaxID=650104 RepID=A0ABW0GLQ3_9MICO
MTRGQDEDEDPFGRLARRLGERGLTAGPSPGGGRHTATAASDEPSPAPAPYAGVDAVAPRPRPSWRVTGLPRGVVVAVVALVVVVVVLLAGLVGDRGGVVSAAAPGSPSEAGAAAVSGVPAVTPAVGAPSGPAPAEVPGAPAAPDPPAVAADAEVLVHVDGAVAEPGVVRLRTGDRVADAVEAAGGVVAGADTRLVNLARPVVDGELVVVPTEGEQPVAVPGPGAVTDPTARTSGPPGVLDLNAADVAALDALPGIGPVLAERVVAHREEVGPFGSVDELADVSGIGPSVLEQVRDLVTV